MSDLLLTLTKNDTYPLIYMQLRDKFTELALDLSASTTVITAKFRALNATTTLWEATATKVKANLGVIYIEIPASGLDQDAGRYEIEVTVTFNSEIQTSPDIIAVKLRDEFPAVA